MKGKYFKRMNGLALSLKRYLFQLRVHDGVMVDIAPYRKVIAEPEFLVQVLTKLDILFG